MLRGKRKRKREKLHRTIVSSLKKVLPHNFFQLMEAWEEKLINFMGVLLEMWHGKGTKHIQ